MRRRQAKKEDGSGAGVAVVAVEHRVAGLDRCSNVGEPVESTGSGRVRRRTSGNRPSNVVVDGRVAWMKGGTGFVPVLGSFGMLAVEPRGLGA